MNSTLQSIDMIVRPQGHVFYGWWIALAALGIQMLSSALWMQSYGAYNQLLQEEFGWSATVVAGAFALTRVESGLLGPLQGWMVDRFGPRAILQIGFVTFGLGFILFGQIDSILGFYLTFILVAVGSSLAGHATVIVPLVHWFDRHRSKAVALSQIGFSAGGLSVPLVIIALDTFGWRETALASGVLVIVVGIPLAQIFRQRPDAHGELPDGEPHATLEEGDSSLLTTSSLDQDTRDFNAREAMRTRAFWFISIGHGCALLTVGAVMVHMVPHLTRQLDMSLAEAGGFIALLTAFQMIGQIAGGYFGDKFEKRVICALCLAGHGTGLLFLAYATSLTMVLAFTLIHGLAWGMRGPMMTAMRADYFGASSFGTIMGFSSMIVMFGMMVGPIVAGFMADRTGSYASGFTVLALGSLLGVFFFLFATPPKRPLRV
ncbi:MAG: MFS transporter, partial [Pseudomonadales bacterium]